MRPEDPPPDNRGRRTSAFTVVVQGLLKSPGTWFLVCEPDTYGKALAAAKKLRTLLGNRGQAVQRGARVYAIAFVPGVNGTAAKAPE